MSYLESAGPIYDPSPPRPHPNRRKDRPSNSSLNDSSSSAGARGCGEESKAGRDGNKGLFGGGLKNKSGLVDGDVRLFDSESFKGSSTNLSNLSRSKSLAALFVGGVSTSNSEKRIFSNTLSTSVSSEGKPNMSILGEGFRSPSMQRKPLQSTGKGAPKNGPKLPKTPRPARTQTIVESLTKGLRDCISHTREEVQRLVNFHDSSDQGKNYNREKQIKHHERYLKRLEFHLSTIEELYDSYDLHRKLREGVRNMAQAYVTSGTKSQKESLLNVKSGFKECTQTMCAIEHSLENMMGTFHLSMKGIQGYSRLCPGDVFEVTMKYGQQKWKTKCRLGKDLIQSFDSQTATFKALLGEAISIKTLEVKNLAKSVLLGLKHCETKDLFSAHAQIMTVNMNVNGSLKLSVVISWNPLEGFDESLPLPTTTLANSSISSASSTSSERRRLSSIASSMPPSTPRLGPHQYPMGVADCYASSQSSRPGSSASRGGDAATCCSSEPDNSSVFSDLPPSDSFSREGEGRNSGGAGSNRFSGGNQVNRSDSLTRLNMRSVSDAASLQHQRNYQKHETPRRPAEFLPAAMSPVSSVSSSHTSVSLTSSVSTGPTMTSTPSGASSSAAASSSRQRVVTPPNANARLTTTPVSSSTRDLRAETGLVGLATTGAVKEGQGVANVELRGGKQDGRSSKDCNQISKHQRPFLNYNDFYADDITKFNDINKSSLLSLSRKSPQHFPATLDEALQNLVATLEDYRGQWRELRDLEDQVGLLEEVLRGEASQSIYANGRPSSMSSGEEIHLTVETALEAFDFLNCEEEDEEEEEEGGEVTRKRQPKSPITSDIPLNGSLSRTCASRNPRRRYRVSRHPSLERTALHRRSGGGANGHLRVGGSCPRGGGTGVAAALRNQLALSEASSPTRLNDVDDSTGSGRHDASPLTPTSSSSSSNFLKQDLRITASQKELMTSTVDSGVESLAAAGKQLQDSFGDEDQNGDGIQYRHPSNSSIPTSSPLPPSTGVDQVDKALLHHLVYCERLMENLGAFGPLKCREIYALEKLSRQAEILGQLLRLVQDVHQRTTLESKCGDFKATETCLDQLLQELFPSEELRQFWRRCCSSQASAAVAVGVAAAASRQRDSGAPSQRDSASTSLGATSLCGVPSAPSVNGSDNAGDSGVLLAVSLDVLVEELENEFGEYIRGAFPGASPSIFDEISARIMDEADVHLSMAKNSSVNSNASSVTGKKSEQRSRKNKRSSSDGAPLARGVTALQLSDYLARFKSFPMPLTAAVRSVGAELCATRNLRSSHPDVVIKELLKMRDNLAGEESRLPPPLALKALSLIILDPSQYHSEILQSVDIFMKQLPASRPIRDDAILVFIEALEENSNPELRSAACICLSRLRAKESSDRLVYLCQTDPSLDVRAKAKEALLSFGSGGCTIL